ncbi:MAG: ABC transporter substrate-binding protein [Pseudomonadota bacterium]
MRRMSMAVTTVLVVLSANAVAQDKGTLKVGGLATLEGAFTVLGEDSMRGIEVALEEAGYAAGGYTIELIKGSSDASPDSAIRAARKLVEQDEVAVLIGPLSGSEGLAMKDYAKLQPQTTFINGSSAAQDTTLRDPAENFFRFSTDGAQWMAGLGTYVVEEKGYKRIATLGEDYSFPYTMIFGFLSEFCAAGGEVTERFWVPIGQKDYGSIIAALPDDIDAILVGLGGGDAVNFLNQYQQAGGETPFIAGSITVDQTILSQKGSAKQALIGTPSAGPQADSWDDPTWQAFVKLYQDTFPEDQRFPSPSLFATAYYTATKAMIEALNAVDGDLSDGQTAFREALSTLELVSPTGTVTLDENRNGIANIFLTEVVEGEGGNLQNQLIKVIPGVNQTLGFPRDEFLALGEVGRDVPTCN